MESPTPNSGDVAPERVKNRATWLIRQAYARSSACLDDAFRDGGDGYRGYHFRLLAALEHTEETSQADLGRASGIDPSDVTETMTELLARNLVQRRIDPEDRRRNLVSITRQGRRRLEALDGVVSAAQDRLLDPLTTRERHQLLRLLHKILENPDR